MWHFYDLDIEFPGTRKKVTWCDLDEYINFRYDPKLYEENLYLDVLGLLYRVILKKLIDENQPHETLKGWCCNKDKGK